jgi:hypothetical protein
MSIYNIVLFLHIVGAIGYFLGIGIWLFILLGLKIFTWNKGGMAL